MCLFHLGINDNFNHGMNNNFHQSGINDNFHNQGFNDNFPKRDTSRAGIFGSENTKTVFL